MRRSVLQTLRALTVPTLGLALAALVVPGHLATAVHVWLLVVCAIALLAVLAALRGAYPAVPRSPFEEALEREPREEERLPELARLEREVTLGVASLYDLHYRLRPTLRETASGLLAVRRGIDLDREPARARAALGEQAWELVRPDRPPPADRVGRGLDPAAVRGVVEALEAL